MSVAADQPNLLFVCLLAYFNAFNYPISCLFSVFCIVLAAGRLCMFYQQS